jgi:hypothetical protein
MRELLELTFYKYGAAVFDQGLRNRPTSPSFPPKEIRLIHLSSYDPGDFYGGNVQPDTVADPNIKKKLDELVHEEYEYYNIDLDNTNSHIFDFVISIKPVGQLDQLDERDAPDEFDESYESYKRKNKRHVLYFKTYHFTPNERLVRDLSINKIKKLEIIAAVSESQSLRVSDFVLERNIF